MDSCYLMEAGSQPVLFKECESIFSAFESGNRFTFGQVKLGLKIYISIEKEKKEKGIVNFNE